MCLILFLAEHILSIFTCVRPILVEHHFLLFLQFNSYMTLPSCEYGSSWKYKTRRCGNTLGRGTSSTSEPQQTPQEPEQVEINEAKVSYNKEVLRGTWWPRGSVFVAEFQDTYSCKDLAGWRTRTFKDPIHTNMLVKWNFPVDLTTQYWRNWLRIQNCYLCKVSFT